MAETRHKRFLLLALGGILTGLTLIFPKAGFAEWLTLVPVGIFLLSEADAPHTRLRGTYGYGFFFFMCYYIVVFHWFIYLYPLDFISGMTPLSAMAVVLAGSIGLSALQATGGGLMFVAVRLLLRTDTLTRHKALRPFCVAGVWAVYEWTQTFGWWGVPWGRLPLGQSQYIVGLQTASLLGSYFVTFLIVAVNLCAAYAVLYRSSIRLMAVCASAILVFNYGVGTALYFADTDGEEQIKVAAVQGNIDSNEKWTAESKRRTLEVYEEYTLKAAQEGAELVVWPETALPYTVTEDNGFGEYCSSLARRAGVTLLVGAFTEDQDGQYNSVICVTPDGSFHETVYSKQRLVPFGEFVPMRGLVTFLIPPLAELSMLAEDVLAGDGANVIAHDNANIGCLICFDSIYEELTRSSVLGGAELICLSTNDSWFSDSAALYMHNAQAQLRAIESGRYVVRAANTGISTVIDAKGRVLAELEPLVDGMAVETVSLNTHSTVYSLVGNAFIYALIIAFAAVSAMEFLGKKAHSKR